MQGRISIYDLLNSSPVKNKRKRINASQYDRLMETFEQTDTPSSDVRENLAIELHMTKREVQVWFQNRRAKLNRESKQRQKTASNEMSAIDLLASAAEYVQSDQSSNKRKSYLH
ncbi:Homeodomain-like protein [Sporodiniella umbellata]|nr:Homeodomain-like protein [Sporodiniella umbellata]